MCLPLLVTGQQVRLKEVEITGSEYKRLYFSFFDSLLSEIRTYNKDEKWTNRVIFTYNESYTLPVGVNVYESGQVQTWGITYKNGHVASIALAGIETPQGYLFSYDESSQLKSIKLIGKVKGTWTYVFNNGNLSSIAFKMPRSFPLTAKNKTYSTYDNYVNFWELTTKVFVKHRAILATFFGDDCWSLNNPLQFSMDHREGEKLTKYTYEYDSAGNPVKITIQVSGEPDTIMKLTYGVK